MYKIGLVSGDGIGPEIINESVKVLKAIAGKFKMQFQFIDIVAGGISIDTHGTPLTEAALDKCKKCDGILFGAVGGSKWDELPKELRPESAILLLRKKLGLYANLTPVVLFEPLVDASPLKKEIIGGGLNLLIIRELTGGLYFGKPKGRETSQGEIRAFDTMVYTETEIKRIARLAFETALGRVKHLTSVDKANVLETSRLWRQVVSEAHGDHKEHLGRIKVLRETCRELKTDVALLLDTKGPEIRMGAFSDRKLSENKNYNQFHTHFRQ